MSVMFIYFISIASILSFFCNLFQKHGILVLLSSEIWPPRITSFRHYFSVYTFLFKLHLSQLWRSSFFGLLGS